MKKVLTTDREGLYKDPETGSVINLNDKEYQKFQQQKLIKNAKQQREKDKEIRLNNLEQELKDLKTGINKILEILNNDRN